jgi:hypothetical protein
MFRKFDRRALIFFMISALSLILLIPCPPDFRYVGITLSVVYGVLGFGSYLDARGLKRSKKRT